MTIAEVYQSRKNDPCWNTSYPISPSDWAVYRVPGPLSFENDHRLSFYIHIPFCKQLCSFCEYTICLAQQQAFVSFYKLYSRLLFHFIGSTAGLVFLDDVVHLLGTALVEAHVAVVALHELVDGSEDDFL